MNARQTMGGNRDGQSRVRLAQWLGVGTLGFAVVLSSGLQARAATTESGATGSTAATASSTAPANETKPKTTSGKAAAGTYGMPQVEAINESVRKSWADHHLNPSPMANDGEWCRRVYLDIIGRIPSVEELTAFLSNRKPNKKLDLVNQLLGDKYVDEYARNWSNIWSTLLIGRPGNERGRRAQSGQPRRDGSVSAPLVRKEQIVQDNGDGIGLGHRGAASRARTITTGR